MNIKMIRLLTFLQSLTRALIIKELMENSNTIDSLGWIDSLNILFNDQMNCEQSKTGPFLGPIKNNITKIYTSLPPHYYIQLSIDLFLFGKWSIDNWIEIIFDGNIIFSQYNVQSQEFKGSSDYCINNIIGNKLTSTQLITLNANIFHQSENIELTIQGNFQCSNVNECGSIGIKNIHINIQECNQNCLTCSGPLNSNCLTCPSGTPKKGSCKCVAQVSYQNTCLDVCPLYFYDFAKECLPDCSQYCLDCQKQVCYQCVPGYYLLEGICVLNCPNYTISQAQNCVDIQNLSNSIYLGKYFYTQNTLISNEVTQFSFNSKLYNSQLTTQKYSLFQDMLILGGFGVWSGGTYTLNIQSIQTHQILYLNMDVYFFDDWQGESFLISVDNQVIYTRIVDNINSSLGNQYYMNKNDQKDSLSLIVQHNSSIANIDFTSTLDKSSFTASLGITNLFILVDNLKYSKKGQCQYPYQNIEGYCIICDASSNHQSNCQCLQGFYNDTVFTCKQCSSECQTCLTLATCLSCPDGYYLQEGKCSKCQFNCQICKDYNQCLTCKDGYYNENFNCLNCMTGCLKCLDQSSCITCASNYYKNNEGICGQCESGYYLKNSNCEKCDIKCLTCNQYQCLECAYPRISPPKCDCNDGYYDSNNICKLCSLQCSTCSNNDTYCLSCSANRIDPPLCDCPIGSTSKLDIGIIKCSTCLNAYTDIKFSNSLDTIIVNFSKPINLNLSFLCSMIFQQITLKSFGIKPNCYLKKNQLNISLGENPTIQVYDILHFTNASLSYQECSEPIEQFSGNSLKMPDISVLPIILFDVQILEYPQTMQFHISSKFNDGKRQMIINEWTLGYSQFPDAKVDQLIQSLRQQTDKSEYVLPYIEFDKENTFNFTLIYNNFIGNKGQTNLVVNVHPVMDYFRVNVTLSKAPYYQNQDLLILFYFYLIEQGDENQNDNIKIILTFKQAEDNNFTLNYELQGQLNQYLEFKQRLADFNINVQYSVIIEVQLGNQSKLNQNYIFYVDQNKPDLIILSNIRNLGYNQILQLNARLTLGYEPYEIQWKCMNLESKTQCVDSSKNNQLLIFESSLDITIDSFVFKPYQVLQFQIQVVGDSFIVKSYAVIMVIEEYVPTLILEINQALYEKQINYYDKVHLKYSYTDTTTNPDLLLYIGGFFVNKTVIHQQSYQYLEIVFSLWEFTEYLTQRNLDFEFTIFNSNFFMPAKYIFTFKINPPPSNCKLLSNITFGMAIVDSFLISVNECIDENTPLQYRFVLYQSEQNKNNDYSNGIVHQGIILQEYSYSNQMVTFLSGNDTIIIMAMVKDQMQGISNHTIIISLSQNNFTEQEYTALLNQYTQHPSKQSEQIIQLILLDYMYKQGQNLFQQFYQAILAQSNFNSTQYFNQTMDQLLLQLSIYEKQSQKEDYIHQQLLNLNISLQNYYNQLLGLWNSQNSLQYNNEQFKMKTILEDIHFQAEILDKLITQHNYFISKDIYRNLQENNEQNNSYLIINQVNQIRDILQVEQVTNNQQLSELSLQEYSIKTKKISQKILNSEVGNVTNASSQYLISQISYKINPYYQDLAFKQYTNSEPTSYQEIQLKSSDNQVISQIDNTISYYYEKSQLNQKKIYECAQKTIDSWSQENCLTEVTETQIFCQCNKIVATTLIEAAQELLYSLKYIFSLNALQKLGSYNFVTSIFIYLLFFQTILYCWILFRGNQMDKKQGNEDLSRSKVVPFKALSLTTINEKRTPDSSKTPNQIKRSLCNKSQQKVQFNIMKFEQTDMEAQIMTSKQNNDKEIDSIIFQHNQSVIGQIKNGELSFLQAYLQYLKYFHKISSIYTRYDQRFSRCFRATQLYISLLGQMSILIFFGRIINLYTIVSLTIFQGIFGFIYRTILSFSLSSKTRFVQYFGVFLSTNSCILFYYVILVCLTKYETQLQCVFWGLIYISNVFLIHIIYAPIIQLSLFIILVKLERLQIIKKIFKLLLYQPEYEFFFGKPQDQQGDIQ